MSFFRKFPGFYWIVNSKLAKVKNIAGPALVKAVKELEPLGKGPRLFCDVDFFQQLDSEMKQYCRQLSDDNYEILWPAFYYIKNNPVEVECNKIHELIRPASNLWKAYNHLPFGVYYWEFLRLVVGASIKYFEIQGNKTNAEDLISKCFASVGLKDKLSALLITPHKHREHI